MDLRLEGKTALVTGASKGIGYAAAVRLAAEGCDVHLVARTQRDLEAAQSKIRDAASTEVTVHPLDLSQSENIDRIAEVCAGADIVVNNAGAIPGGTMETIDEDTWRAAWDLKVFGYINLCRRAYANMRERGRGVIINIIGVAGERPGYGYVAGGAANAALMALTRALGGPSIRDGIRVVGINPGLIHTERMETLLRTNAKARFDDEERWRDLVSQEYPPGQPEHIADMVAFLASDLSSNTSGTIITIDGGSSSR
ncbi:MAG: short-chain dehydrogenase/reductase [Gammaproteobacteria bacterium]|nr:short-chain dehydrogenase/reductase [Gammaproteobacteria bacterium]